MILCQFSSQNLIVTFFPFFLYHLLHDTTQLVSFNNWTVGLVWSVLVSSQDDEHCNLIQIKTADFFFFILPSLPHIIVSSRKSWRWLIVVVDYGVWIEVLECICCSWRCSFEIPKLVLKCTTMCVVVVFMCVSLRYVNNTWTIQEIRLEDGCSVWLSLSCCSAFTHTAGAYITVRLPVLTLFPSVSLPLPSLLTYWSVLVFISVPTWTLLTPNTD